MGVLIWRHHEILFDDQDIEVIEPFHWGVMDRRGRQYAVSGTGPRGTSIRLMHKLIIPGIGFDVDHINMNGLDNRRVNLRVATRSQNMANSRSRGGSSQYKGVCWRKDTLKWQASIKINYKQINLGSYADEVQAALAYDRAARHYFGEFARLNFEESS